MRKYKKMKYGFILRNASFILRVELGDLSVSTVLFSIVLHLWLIHVMNLAASALILFCCKQPIYSIDRSHFYAKQYAGQEKTLRILGFRRPVRFGSLQSLSSLPYCVAQRSGTPQHIRSRCISAKEREKIQRPSLFLLCCCRRCREEKCDPRGSLQTVRREYMVKVKISLRMLYLKEFQIQSSFDASGFKLSFGSRHCRWCCLQAEDSPVQPVQRTSGGREGTRQWAVRFLYQNIASFSTETSELMIPYWWQKHFVNKSPLEMKPTQLMMLKGAGSQTTGKHTRFESSGTTEPPACH